MNSNDMTSGTSGPGPHDPASPSSGQHQAKAQKTENPWSNLIFNIIAPTLIWMKLSDPTKLGPVYALCLGLAFPIGYAIYDWVRTRRYNLFSILGIVSLLLTGTLALIQVSLFWFAVKEATIPLIIGCFALLSIRTKSPLVETFIFNAKVFNVQQIKTEVDRRQLQPQMQTILFRTNLGIAASFFQSAAINYALARYILQSPPGTPEFTAELGKMNGLSFIAITLPCMLVLMGALFYMVKSLGRLTGLSTDQMMNDPKRAAPT